MYRIAVFHVIEAHEATIRVWAMRIHNIYEDEAGESHFRDIDVEWTEVPSPSTVKSTKLIPTSGLIFREVAASYDLSWRRAPHRQYVVNLDAAVEITTSDGETRVVGAGEVVLVEDLNGKGHCAKSVAGQVRHSIYIRAPERAAD